jgi:hypothetical protein
VGPGPAPVLVVGVLWIFRDMGKMSAAAQIDLVLHGAWWLADAGRYSCDRTTWFSSSRLAGVAAVAVLPYSNPRSKALRFNS